MRDAPTANDNEPVFTLTRTQLENLVTRAVREAMQAGLVGPALVDKQDMARQLGCSPSQVDHLRKQGMPWVPVGQVVRFEPVKVLEWLRAHPRETA